MYYIILEETSVAGKKEGLGRKSWEQFSLPRDFSCLWTVLAWGVRVQAPWGGCPREGKWPGRGGGRYWAGWEWHACVLAREPSRAGDQSLCEVGSASRWRKLSSVSFPCLEVAQHRGQGPGSMRRQPTWGESPGRGLGTREGCPHGRKVWHGVPTPSGVKRTFVCMCSAWEVRDWGEEGVSMLRSLVCQSLTTVNRASTG